MKLNTILKGALSVFALTAIAGYANAKSLNTGVATYEWQSADSVAAVEALIGSTTGWSSTTDVEGWPVGAAWTDTSASGSKWITPERGATDAGGQWSSSIGKYYIFKTDFTVPVGKTFDTTLSGSWLSDNSTSGVYLNTLDHAIAATLPGEADFNKPVDTFKFAVNDGSFVEGVNSLYFITYNEAVNKSGNPAGLNVVGAADVPAVPEPAFVQLGVLLSSGGLLALRKHRA